MAQALLIESIVNSEKYDTREKREHAISELERELLLPLGHTLHTPPEQRLEHAEAPHRAPVTDEQPAGAPEPSVTPEPVQIDAATLAGLQMFNHLQWTDQDG